MAESLAAEPNRLVSLPPSVVLDDGGEIVAQHGKLHAEMRQHRVETRHEQAMDAAKRAVLGLDPTVREFSSMFEPDSPLREIAVEGHVARSSIDARIAANRVVLNALGQSAGEANLIERSRHMSAGDVVTIDSGKGFIVSGSAQAKGRPAWRVEVSKDQSKIERGAALDEFTRRFRAATQKQTSAHQELQKGLEAGQPAVYSSESFKWTEESDIIIDLFESGAYYRPNMDASPAMQRAQFIEYLYALPAHYPGDTGATGILHGREGIYFDEHGNIEKVLVASAENRAHGVYICLQSADPTQHGDLTEIPLKLGVEVYGDEAYAELDYGNKLREGTQPFIETETAGQLLDSFEAAGLQINQQLRDIISETGIEKRFGQGYAALTREIAKLVSDPNRELSRLFADPDAAEKIRSLQDVADPAAQVVINLLKGVIDRVASPQDAPVLPASSHRIDIRDGSCKDIEVYLSGRAAQTDSATGATLLKSSYARPVTMTMQPTYLNGVRLPAGTLLAIEDDGYVMMRVTGFAFDDAEALEVFGVQEGENRTNNSYARSRSTVRSGMVF